MGDDSTGGQWAPEELEDIHILELRAALFALKCFKRSIISGNSTTAVVAINNQDRSHCDKTNYLAFETLKFTPEIDLFASSLNIQFPRYCTYRPDPDAKFIDACSMSWSYIKFYCFPPFSCIPRAVRKIIQDQAFGILVIPNWPTQPWYPVLMPLLIQPPVILHVSTDLRLMSSPETVHPLHKKLKLHICLVSGKTFTTRLVPRCSNNNSSLLEKWNEVSVPDTSVCLL